MTVNQRKEENLNRLFKFLLDSQDIPFARKACRHVYPSTKPGKPDPINKMDQKTGVFGFLKAQKEWCENNNMSYVAFCCCCVLPNTAEPANMISSASACRRGQKYCVGITQHMFKAGRWQVQSGVKKPLLYVMHS